jgi:hypothetical protein
MVFGARCFCNAFQLIVAQAKGIVDFGRFH